LACGNVWHVEMFGMWKCLACGNVWQKTKSSFLPSKLKFR
jgi:hypothetical protein